MMSLLKTANLSRILALLVLPLSAAAGHVRWAQPEPPLRALVVGGGPDVEHNQVAIESNVRYLDKILPAGTPLRVLFADGSLKSKDVQCQGDDKKIYYRTPELPRLDGPAESASVRTELSALSDQAAKTPATPVLLYFTGHGSPDRRSNYDNNRFDLWDKEDFSVRDLASSIKSFPARTPITVVMVQCFSGAFGNLLFQGGDPSSSLADHRICGFFAAVSQRMAAGCTPEINESDYKDFSGYFFSALTGTDRMGHKIEGADYDHNGKIGMNEAFAYSLIHDDSIDTPVCTSDVFLRKFVSTPDADVFKEPFNRVRSWASPSQKAALDQLSDKLGLTGDDRLLKAYDEIGRMEMETDDLRDVRTLRFVRLAKSVVLAHQLRESGDKAVQQRFEQLLADESGNPFK